MVTHPSTNLAALGWESNLRLFDHKSDALTATIQYNHLYRAQWSTVVESEARVVTGLAKGLNVAGD